MIFASSTYFPIGCGSTYAVVSSYVGLAPRLLLRALLLALARTTGRDRDRGLKEAATRQDDTQCVERFLFYASVRRR